MIEIFSCFLFLAKPTQNGTAGCVKLLLFFPSCYCACNYESTEHRVGILHFEILTSSFCDVRCCLALVVHFFTVAAALSFVFVGVFRLKHTTLSKDSGSFECGYNASEKLLFRRLSSSAPLWGTRAARNTHAHTVDRRKKDGDRKVKNFSSH